MKKSRVLALGLTAALSVSLLAGCGTGDTQTTPAPEGSTPVETGTTGAANELNVCLKPFGAAGAAVGFLLAAGTASLSHDYPVAGGHD